jgi:predicted DNA-binding transcriptional regulator AlpA
MTRQEVAKLLGISQQSVYWAEKCGRIPLPMRLDGFVFYLRAPIEEYAAAHVRRGARRKVGRQTEEDIKLGELASKIVAMIQDGKDLAQIVVACKVTPEFARRIWGEMHTGFHLAEVNKMRSAEQRYINRLSREREAARKLDHREETQRIKANGRKR